MSGSCIHSVDSFKNTDSGNHWIFHATNLINSRTKQVIVSIRKWLNLSFNYFNLFRYDTIDSPYEWEVHWLNLFLPKHWLIHEQNIFVTCKWLNLSLNRFNSFSNETSDSPYDKMIEYFSRRVLFTQKWNKSLWENDWIFHSTNLIHLGMKQVILQ